MPRFTARIRTKLQVARVLIAGCVAGASLANAAAETRSPNVVLIVADDLGYGELGCYGGRDVPTPHLNHLAASGVRFTNGYVTASLCAPSRAALLTGRYQTSFGFEKNATGAMNADPRVGVPPNEAMLPERLRSAGYVTALVGKWHLGGTAAHHPQRRGFNEFFGFLHEGHYYTPAPWSGVTTWLRRKALPDGGQGRWTSADGQVIWSTHLGTNEPDYDVDNPLLRSTNPVAENNHLTDAFAREACDFIGRHAAQPFFLYLAFNAVHSPLQAANRYLERFAHIPDIHRRIFAAQLAHLDESVGQVMAALQQHGLAEDTLVAFISDNGGPTAELTSSNAPLRGGKGSLFEGGIRVPFIVRWPHRLPAGTVSAVPVTTLDLTPTLLMAAGVDRSSWQTDGGPLNEILAAPNGDRSLFWRMSPRAAVRRGGWKLVREGANGNAGEWQLYDLVNDPSESSNLATVETARVKDLAAAWEAWNRVQRTSNW